LPAQSTGGIKMKVNKIGTALLAACFAFTWPMAAHSASVEDVGEEGELL